MWRSTNGGNTWVRAAITPPSAKCATDLSAYAVTLEQMSGRLWAGTSCGIASSIDQGASWTYASTAPGYAALPATASYRRTTR
jgi:hypothetical protein